MGKSPGYLLIFLELLVVFHPLFQHLTNPNISFVFLTFVCIRMTYTEKPTELMGSENDPMSLASLGVTNDSLENQAEQSSETEGQTLKPTAAPEVLPGGAVVTDLQQFRQHLRDVKFAAQAVDQFLAIVRDVEAKIPVLLADLDTSRQQDEADEKLARQPQTTGPRQGNEDEMNPSPCPAEAAGDAPQQEATLEEEPSPPVPLSEVGKETRLDAEVNLPNGEGDSRGGNQEQTSQVLRSNEDAEKQRRGRRRRGQAKEKEDFLQRRAALVTALRDVQGAAESLKLQEATLTALQRR